MYVAWDGEKEVCLEILWTSKKVFPLCLHVIKLQIISFLKVLSRTGVWTGIGGGMWWHFLDIKLESSGSFSKKGFSPGFFYFICKINSIPVPQKTCPVCLCVVVMVATSINFQSWRGFIWWMEHGIQVTGNLQQV